MARKQAPRLWHATISWTKDNERYKREFVLSAENKSEAEEMISNRLFKKEGGETPELRIRDLGPIKGHLTYFSTNVIRMRPAAALIERIDEDTMQSSGDTDRVIKDAEEQAKAIIAAAEANADKIREEIDAEMTRIAEIAKAMNIESSFTTARKDTDDKNILETDNNVNSEIEGQISFDNNAGTAEADTDDIPEPDEEFDESEMQSDSEWEPSNNDDTDETDTGNADDTDGDIPQETPAEPSSLTDDMLEQAVASFQPDVIEDELKDLTYMAMSLDGRRKGTLPGLIAFKRQHKTENLSEEQLSRALAEFVRKCLPVNGKTAIRYVYDRCALNPDEEEEALE